MDKCIYRYCSSSLLSTIGIDEVKNETTHEIENRIVEVINNKLHVDVVGSDIEALHRVGKSQKRNARGVIVKFVNRKKKDSVLRQRRLLKGTGVTITEDLTKTNLDRLMTVRSNPSVDNAWTHNGKNICYQRWCKSKI